MLVSLLRLLVDGRLLGKGWELGPAVDVEDIRVWRSGPE